MVPPHGTNPLFLRVFICPKLSRIPLKNMTETVLNCLAAFVRIQ